MPGLLKYAACSIWGGDDGSNQEAHIRSKGSADAEAAGGGTQGSGNPEAKGDRRQGGCHTQEEQEGLGRNSPASLRPVPMMVSLTSLETYVRTVVREHQVGPSLR